jgi:hypothetical protein
VRKREEEFNVKENDTTLLLFVYLLFVFVVVVDTLFGLCQRTRLWFFSVVFFFQYRIIRVCMGYWNISCLRFEWINYIPGILVQLSTNRTHIHTSIHLEYKLDCVIGRKIYIKSELFICYAFNEQIELTHFLLFHPINSTVFFLLILFRANNFAVANNVEYIFFLPWNIPMTMNYWCFVWDKRKAAVHFVLKICNWIG